MAWCTPDPIPAFCSCRLLIAEMHFCFGKNHGFKKIKSRDKVSSKILAACCSHLFWWQRFRFGAGISSVLKKPLVLIIFIFHSIIYENIIEGHLVVIQPQSPRNKNKENTHHKHSCLFTKRDTLKKYPDTTRKSVMNNHLSSIPTRHASTPQCTNKYWTEWSI